MPVLTFKKKLFSLLRRMELFFLIKSINWLFLKVHSVAPAREFPPKEFSGICCLLSRELQLVLSLVM